MKQKQYKAVLWDDIKDNPPEQLKVSPIAMIPHKPRRFSAILDLSVALRLLDGSMLATVDESSEKTAPSGAINQLGFSLPQIIHAFLQASPEDKVFMAKWDIKDGFWRLDCEEGKEWNFAYVLPQPEGAPIKLVVPTLLQVLKFICLNLLFLSFARLLCAHCSSSNPQQHSTQPVLNNGIICPSTSHYQCCYN